MCDVRCVNAGTVSDLPISVASEVNDDHGDLEAAPTQRNGYWPLAVDEVRYIYFEADMY